MDNDVLRGMIEQAMLSQSIWASITDLPQSTMMSKSMMIIFKWPDIVKSLVDYMDNKEDSEDRLVKDLHDIILYPLVSICKGYIEFSRHKNISIPFDLKELEQEANILLNNDIDTTDKKLYKEQTSAKARRVVSIINSISAWSNDLSEIKEF